MLCGRCGAVWTVWYCVVQLCVLRLCSHGTACQGSCRPSFSLRRDYNFFAQGLRKTAAAGENKSLLGDGLYIYIDT